MTGVDGGTGQGARTGRRWDVALSFAGAQRGYVRQVAQALKARGVRCFYDADEQVRLWGTHLAEELPLIYARESVAVVVFVSADYAGRDWTRLERRAAFSRAVIEAGVYVLPARFDDSELPGLLPDVVAVDLRRYTPGQFADLIVEKLADLGVIEGLSESIAYLDGRRMGPDGIARTALAKLGRARWRIPRLPAKWAKRGVAAVAISVALSLIGYGVAWVNGRSKMPDPPPPSGCTAQLGGLNNNERIGFVVSSCFPAGSDIAVVAKDIETENTAVLNSKTPYRTVVFFGVITSSTNGAPNPASLFQLRGVQYAQQQYNQDNPKIKIRVLLANAADQFQAGLAVANLIDERVRQDHSIVAVIGIGQSRTYALKAIQTLGELDLPVIGTSVTGQAMKSKNFFRISPSDQRQAQLAATFAQRKLKAHTALIFVNENQYIPGNNSDLYSQDLAGQFSSYFSDSTNTVIDVCHYGEQETPEVICDGNSLTIPQLRERICQEKPDMIFFAGRAETLPQLFTTPGGTCDHLPTLLGSSDVPKYAETPALREAILKFGSQLYYISFAPAKLGGCFTSGGQFSDVDPLHRTGQRPFQTEQMCDFLRDYRTAWKPSGSQSAADNDAGLTYDSSDAMLGYDALQTILQVINVTGNPTINGPACCRHSTPARSRSTEPAAVFPSPLKTILRRTNPSTSPG